MNNSTVVSTTFLFDRGRSGRLKNRKGNLRQPVAIWQTRLPNSPPHSPESTAIFDSAGNTYFGCHDGCFYSLNAKGQIRWNFKTSGKIYSSPCFVDGENALCFCSGDGKIYSLNTDGDLLWKQTVGEQLVDVRTRILRYYHKKYSHVLHEENRIASALCWSSPNLLSSGTVLTTGYKHGLQCFDGISGERIWRLNFSAPKAHLAGTAVTKEGVIFVAAQQGPIVSVSSSGKVIWKRRLKRGFNVWGNPSVDEDNETVYVPASRREEEALIFAFDFSGRLKWKVQLPGGTRGSVTISYEDYVVVCCYDGWLRFLEKESGRIMQEVHASKEHLWTSCSIDPDGNLFVSTIDSDVTDSGRLRCFDKAGTPIWEVSLGKGHSVPVIDGNHRIYLGCWQGKFHCFQT